MYIEANIEDLKEYLDLENVKMGDEIIYCPRCYFQTINVGMKNECPDCGKFLMIVKANEELLN